MNISETFQLRDVLSKVGKRNCIAQSDINKYQYIGFIYIDSQQRFGHLFSNATHPVDL